MRKKYGDRRGKLVQSAEMARQIYYLGFCDIASTSNDIFNKLSLNIIYVRLQVYPLGARRISEIARRR